MLIKDLDHLTAADMRKLGDYGNMSIDQYIFEINSKLNSGIRINDFYKKLYERVKSEKPVKKVPEQIEEDTDSVLLALKDIPIDEIEYYVGSSEIKFIRALKKKEISNLAQLTSFVKPNGPMLLCFRTALEWKELVSSNSQRIISEWKDYNSIHIIPSSFDVELGLVRNLRNALIEYGELLISRSTNRRYFKNRQEMESASTSGSILLELYRDGLTMDESAKKHGFVRSERVRQIKDEKWNDLFCGKPAVENILLNSSIIDVLNSLKSECLFCSIEKYKSFSGSDDVEFLSQIGFDLVDVGEGQFLVPLDTKGNYTKVYKAIVKALLETLLPKDADTITQMVLDNKILENIKFNQEFVNNVLQYPKLVDIFENGTVQIKDKFLTKDTQRYTRIIYNAKRKLTTEEVRKRYEELYNYNPAAGPSTNPMYSICCESKKLWYYGEPLMPIKECISEYAEEHKVFYYSELEQYLLDKGYSIPKSIRTQITDICSVDNKDNNHFCHKDYVEDNLDFSWRNPSQYGQTNWMLNKVRDILLVNSPVEYSSLVAQLKEKAIGTEYEDVVKKRAKYFIPNYCGEQQPFMLENERISINEPYFSETDFATIGLREGKYPFFSQIRSIAFNEVKRSEDGRKALNEIVGVVNEIIEEHIGRNVIIRALEDRENRFDPIDIELIAENGNRYVVWTGKEIIAEPTFEVVATENKEDGEQVNEVIEVEKKPSIKFRQSVNWEELSQILKSELTFCRFWMIREDYELDESIDKFLNFLRNTSNNNLNKKLPQNLYEYWFASTDSYDRSTYLTNLALFFEALLAEIYYQQHGIKLRKRGLSEWAEEFDGLPQKLLYSRDNKGFDRIASDLHFVRNKIAHGDDIEFSSWETAKTITEYVALYVYVIARYYH